MNKTLNVPFNPSGVVYKPIKVYDISASGNTTKTIHVDLKPKPPVYVENDVLVYNLALMEIGRLYPFTLEGEELLIEKKDGNVIRIYEVTE